MSKVSFVVPIFNIENKALQRSIESICGQTHQDIEVILVDDGSVNDALEICNNAAKNDTRIHVIHQENQGVSVARNVGIQKATGDYLAFVDPDDYIDERFAENALSIAKDTNAQIVICQFRIIGEAMDGLNTMQVQEIQTAQVTELQSDVMTQHFDSYSIGSCWGKLFDVNFLKRKQLEFVPGMKKSQDRVFVFDCYGAAEKIVRYAYCGYFYDANNEQSVCHKYNPKIKDILEKTIDAFEVRTKEQKQFEEPKSRMRLMFFYEYLQLWWLHNDAEMSFFTCVKKVKEALREEQYSFALKTAEISKMRKRCQLVFKLCKMHMATIACLIFRILHW